MTVDAQVIPIDESAVAAARAAVVGVQQLSEAISSDDDVNDDDGKSDQHQQQQQQQQRREQQQQQQLQRQQSLGSPGVCRICHSDCWAKGPLISPCRCKGTLAHVHLSCLERWLNQSCRNYCELCNFRYNALETQRYGWFESLRLWINHPRNRGHIRADLLIFILLTVFTAGLASVCLIGSRYFVQEGVKVGYTETWARGTVTIFMMIVIFGYSVAVIFLIKNQAVPWYRWWRGTVNVHLLLDSASELRRLQHQQRLNDLADEQR